MQRLCTGGPSPHILLIPPFAKSAKDGAPDHWFRCDASNAHRHFSAVDHQKPTSLVIEIAFVGVSLMQRISNRLVGIRLFSLSIVIAGQSGHAQTVAQNRIVQQIVVAGKVSPCPERSIRWLGRNMIRVRLRVPCNCRV